MLGDEHRSIIRRDSHLPGLAATLDPERLVHVLQQQAPQAEAAQLELKYIRYKPQRRSLSLWETIDSEGKSKILIASACNTSSWAKLFETGRAETALRRGGLLCHENQLLLEWFPLDHYLKVVAKIFDPAQKVKILGRVLGDASRETHLETLSYKPGKRYVAKVSRQEGEAVLKCYGKSAYDAALAKTRQAIDAGLWKSRLIGFSDRDRSIATQWIEGTTLDEQMVAPEFSVADIEDIGSMLADWHRRGERLQLQGLARHEGHTIERLNELKDDLIWLLPELEIRFSAFASSAFAKLVKWSRSFNVIHGDFYAKQIVVQNGGYELIDFDEMGIGDPYQDIGNFVAQLYWNGVRGDLRWNEIEGYVEHFLAGYEQQVGRLDHDRMACQIAIATFRCLPHPFRRGKVDWPLQIEMMLERAESWLKRSIGFGTFRDGDRSCQAGVSIHSADEDKPYQDIPSLQRAWLHGGEMVSDRLSDMYLEKGRIIRHKAGRRIVLEYDWASHCDPSLKLLTIGKARIRKGLDRRTPELHHQLRQSGMSGDSTTVVPQVLGFVPHLNMWLQEKLDGDPVTCESRTPSEVHRRVGGALSELHSVPIELESSHSVEDELNLLFRALEGVERSHPEWKEDLNRIHRLCLQVASDLMEVSKVGNRVLIHRDFYFDQVLVTPHRIVMLDFDLATMGSPELDVGNYLAHLDEHALRFPKTMESCRVGAESFLDGYMARNPLDRGTVEGWRFLSLARHIAISDRMVGRQHKTRDLIDRILHLQQSPRESRLVER